VISKGTIIGDRYEIKKSLGEGGMANVYLANDILLNREVAIKMLRGELSNEDKFIKRFQREALALSSSSISHPNIVQMYDLGEENNNHYIVMEYVKGNTLKHLLNKRGHLTLTEAVDIMLQLTEGISHAHKSYIIHRDLKPQNIMIEDNGLVKIADFGIAIALNAAQLTQTNSVMGSVHYLPPEQAGGHKATIKSDIYSLGIMFYELLTGVLPFRGENAVEIALKHMKTPIESVKKYNENIPQSVENIILKATAKNPKNRYNDVNEMHQDLLYCLNDEVKNQPKVLFKYPEFNFEEAPKMIIANPEKKESDTAEEKIINKSYIPEDEQPEEKEVKKEKNLLKILGIILVIILLVLGGIFIFTKYFNNNKNIKIPNVSNLSKEDAESVLKENGISINNEIKEVASDSIEKGKVVKTEPSIGSSVKKGRSITIYISSGENKFIVENYKNLNFLTVKTKLEEVYKMKVVQKKKEVESLDSIDQYTILDQEPKEGSKLSIGDTITLYTPDIYEKYPDFVKDKWTIERVRDFARKYNINLQESAVDSEKDKDTIIRQNRVAGSKIEANATLSVSYSKGKSS
jgi:PASTA domain-containing protein kinase